MRMTDVLFGLIPTLLSSLVGWGILMIGTPANFNTARWCFFLSAILWEGLVVMGGYVMDWSFWPRSIVVGLAAAAGAIALTQVLKEISIRQEAFAPTSPSSITPAPLTDPGNAGIWVGHSTDSTYENNTFINSGNGLVIGASNGDQIKGNKFEQHQVSPPPSSKPQ